MPNSWRAQRNGAGRHRRARDNATARARAVPARKATSDLHPRSYRQFQLVLVGLAGADPRAVTLCVADDPATVDVHPVKSEVQIERPVRLVHHGAVYGRFRAAWSGSRRGRGIAEHRIENDTGRVVTGVLTSHALIAEREDGLCDACAARHGPGAVGPRAQAVVGALLGRVVDPARVDAIGSEHVVAAEELRAVFQVGPSSRASAVLVVVGIQVELARPDLQAVVSDRGGLARALAEIARHRAAGAGVGAATVTLRAERPAH